MAKKCRSSIRLLFFLLFALKPAPIHVTVVGEKDDDAVRSLFRTALRIATRFKASNGGNRALVRNDVQYPQLGRTAVFLCAARA